MRPPKDCSRVHKLQKLSREQKLERRKEFIASKAFTEATWTTLILFNQNVQAMTRLIEAEGLMLKELQSEAWREKYAMTEAQRWETIHLGYVDSLSKLMMCIEGLFVLMYAVARDYRKLPRFFTRYQLSQVDVILRLIASPQQARRALWRILGFPNLKYLQLSADDRKTVMEVLNVNVETALKALTRIREFYLDHLTVYGKFKHGLSLLLGLPSNGQAPVESLVYAFDRSSDRPRGTVIPMTEKLNSPFEWFNILQIIPYSDPAFNTISGILNDVKGLAFAVTNNHLTWAENCGQDYLPAKREDDKAHALVYGGPFSEDIKQAYNRIFVQVAEKMTLPVRTIAFQFTLKREKVPEAFKRLTQGNTVTFWINPQQKTGPYFERVPTIT